MEQVWLQGRELILQCLNAKIGSGGEELFVQNPLCETEGTVGGLQLRRMSVTCRRMSVTCRIIHDMPHLTPEL